MTGSMNQQDFLHLQMGSSRLENRIFLAMHVLAILAIAHSAIELYLKFLLIPFIMMSGAIYRRRKLNSNVGWSLRYSSDFGWEVESEESYSPIRILGTTVITPLAIFLHYELQGKTHHRAIFNDAISERDFRRLTVQLKIAGPSECDSDY